MLEGGERDVSVSMLARRPENVGDLVQLLAALSQLQASALDITRLHDAIEGVDQIQQGGATDILISIAAGLMRLRRTQLLVDLLKNDRAAYIDTVSFLPIPRSELPNREGIPLRDIDRIQLALRSAPGRAADSEEGDLVPDCDLEKVPVKETFLDRFLLEVMRDLYTEYANIARSPKEGILGLLDEVRALMMSSHGAPPAEQINAVVRGLRALLSRWTPFVPALFRVVMGGIVPKYDPTDTRPGADPKWLADGVIWAQSKLPSGWLEPGKRLGPTFFAPSLMALVCTKALSPLMGPATLAFRSDGQLGGLVAERCIFLQESNCKGMCLNSCKLPAEQLFDELGLPVRVSPNFETQECNWAFGEAAPPLEEDPTWPKNCVVGCTSRKELKQLKRICD